MKENSVSRYEWIMGGGLALALAAIFLAISVGEYYQARSKGISGYRKALEANLENPDIKNLNQIREGPRLWNSGHEELKVPTSYTDVYKKVDGALVTANALAEHSQEGCLFT